MKTNHDFEQDILKMLWFSGDRVKKLVITLEALKDPVIEVEFVGCGSDYEEVQKTYKLVEDVWIPWNEENFTKVRCEDVLLLKYKDGTFGCSIGTQLTPDFSDDNDIEFYKVVE